MKDETLMYGLIGAGALYAIFKFSNSLSKPVEKFGDSIADTVGTVGTGIGDIVGDIGGVTGGIASPFQSVSNAFRNYDDLQNTKSNALITAYSSPKVQGIYNQLAETQQNRDLSKAKTSLAKTNISTVKAETNLNAISQAAKNNLPEVIQRKTEYGFGGSGFFSKTFLPTTTQADIRVQNLKNTVSKAGKTVASIASKAKNSVSSLIKKVL